MMVYFFLRYQDITVVLFVHSSDNTIWYLMVLDEANYCLSLRLPNIQYVLLHSVYETIKHRL